MTTIPEPYTTPHPLPTSMNLAVTCPLTSCLTPPGYACARDIPNISQEDDQEFDRDYYVHTARRMASQFALTDTPAFYRRKAPLHQPNQPPIFTALIYPHTGNLILPDHTQLPRLQHSFHGLSQPPAPIKLVTYLTKFYPDRIINKPSYKGTLYDF